MFVSVALIELGALFLYAGWTGRSVTALITGDNTKKAATTKTTQGTNPTTSPSTTPPGGLPHQ